MAEILEFWVVKVKGGKEDISWRPQGPYKSRKAARKYRDACINTSLRLGELEADETFTLKERMVAKDGSTLRGF